MNKYNKIMDNVKVTEQMHNRIMKNISTKRYKKHKHYTTIVAGIVLLFISTVIMSYLNNKNSNNLTITSNIESYENINELSNAIGFDVQNLKINADNIIYTSYWNELAEIVYEIKDNRIIYRISKGIEENSGNYKEYLETKQLVMDSLTITLKGEIEGLYNQAVWVSNDTSYSIYSEKPVKEDDFIQYILRR